jgi:3-oxoadipate enol-lactonase
LSVLANPEQRTAKKTMLHVQHTSVAGRTVRYLEAGLGTPMLLLHAFPLSADMWRPQLERPPAGWRLIAPDFRGFGDTPIDSQDVGVDDYAADILLLMDDLGLERPVIAGLSFGGYVSFALFRRAPDRIGGLVLADTRSTTDTEDGLAARRTLLEAIRREGVAMVPDRQIPKVLGATTRRERPEVVAEVRRLIEGNRAPGIEAAIVALMRRPDSTGDLSRIEVPTLIIVGEEDEVTPIADAAAMHRAIRGSSLTILPRAGHLSNLEAADAFSTTISTWVASFH